MAKNDDCRTSPDPSSDREPAFAGPARFGTNAHVEADLMAADASETPDPQVEIRFRCPPELEGRVPTPMPAIEGLPAWLREMPAVAMNPIVDSDDDTVKRCPPFIDAMTCGFLIPLVCDLTCEAGEFSWDLDLPPCGPMEFPRSPIGFHHPAQVTGTPLFEDDRFLIKFHGFWTIETPPGYAMLFMHPMNRFDLPFTTLSGLVDCDRYNDLFINFPARWRDPGFRGVLPRGTPIAQCIPVRRERLQGFSGTRDAEATSRSIRTLQRIRRSRGVYRRERRS